MAWFRPADKVLRVPFTPDSELAKEARAVVEEEASRLGLKVKVVERSGVPLKRQITTSDLGAGKTLPSRQLPLLYNWRRQKWAGSP